MTARFRLQRRRAPEAAAPSASRRRRIPPPPRKAGRGRARPAGRSTSRPAGPNGGTAVPTRPRQRRAAPGGNTGERRRKTRIWSAIWRIGVIFSGAGLWVAAPAHLHRLAPPRGVEARSERGDARQRQPVVNLQAALLVLEHARRLEHRKMSRHCRPPGADRLDQLADAAFAPGQPLDDLQARRMPERLEDGGTLPVTPVLRRVHDESISLLGVIGKEIFLGRADSGVIRSRAIVGAPSRSPGPAGRTQSGSRPAAGPSASAGPAAPATSRP